MKKFFSRVSTSNAGPSGYNWGISPNDNSGTTVSSTMDLLLTIHLFLQMEYPTIFLPSGQSLHCFTRSKKTGH
jgi:hypothetical protein